jgi:1-acyl-sn-glycerol-3-phosphate acyltransferase
MSFFYFANRAWLRLVMRFYFRWHVFNEERLPAEGSAILAANHASYLDPLLIGCAARRDLSYLARESLFRFAAIASVLRAVNVVPVDRDGGG